MPSRDLPDLDQLRTRAKELNRSLSDGDPDALKRVLTSHPKYAGRPAERLKGRTLGLRDAQVVLARESGFDSWKELLDAVDGKEMVRWRVDPTTGILGRALSEANRNHHRFCTGEHFLLALLAPPEPTVAAEVLTELGMTYDDVLEKTRRLIRPDDHDSERTGSTPVYQLIAGFAQGLALGSGSIQLTDGHALLAMVYLELGFSVLTRFDLDPDEVVDGLRARGAAVPGAAPPVAGVDIGPLGPYVYFPEEDFQRVSQEIIKHYPPGTSVWGANRSTWKEGHWYVLGEDEIPLESLVRSAVEDQETIEVLSDVEASKRERQGGKSQAR